LLLKYKQLASIQILFITLILKDDECLITAFNNSK